MPSLILYPCTLGLDESDPGKRVEFCRFRFRLDADNAHFFFSNILWADESKFNLDGITNFDNLYGWAEENSSNLMRESSLRSKFLECVLAAV